jgi:hypothetical protein
MWMTLLNLQGEAPLADYTVLGKVITALLGMFAVGVFAVPTGIVASQFSGFVDDRQEQYEEQCDPTTHTKNSSQQSAEPTVKLSLTVNLTNSSSSNTAAASNSGSTTTGTGTVESDTENARLVQEDSVPDNNTSNSSSSSQQQQQQRRHSKHQHTLTPNTRSALDSSSSGSRSCMQRVYAVCEGDTWFGELFNKGIIALIILSVIQVRILMTIYKQAATTYNHLCYCAQYLYYNSVHSFDSSCLLYTVQWRVSKLLVLMRYCLHVLMRYCLHVLLLCYTFTWQCTYIVQAIIMTLDSVCPANDSSSSISISSGDSSSIDATCPQVFVISERIAVAVFTLEYLMRLYAAPCNRDFR